jgi:hypothetical protein
MQYAHSIGKYLHYLRHLYRVKKMLKIKAKVVVEVSEIFFVMMDVLV